MKFTFVASQRTLDFLLSATARDRRAVAKLLEELAAAPYQQGDYEEMDETGRPVQVKRLGPYLVRWWMDDLVREVRVTRMEKIKLG